MYRDIRDTSGRETTGRTAVQAGRTSSRQGKQRAVQRIKAETRAVRAGSLLTLLRKQGYEELPLDEIQDRLSKLRTALAEFVLSRRG